METLGGSKECGAGESSGPGQVHQELRDGHFEVESRRAQLYSLHVCQGGQETKRRQLRSRLGSLSGIRHPGKN